MLVGTEIFIFLYMRFQLIMVFTQVFPGNTFIVGNFAIISEIVADTFFFTNIAVFPNTAVLYGFISIFSNNYMVVASKITTIGPPVLRYTRADLKLNLITVRVIVELKFIDRFGCIRFFVIPQIGIRNQLVSHTYYRFKAFLCLIEVTEPCFNRSRHIGFTQHSVTGTGSSTTGGIGFRSILSSLFQVVDNELPYIGQRLPAITRFIQLIQVDDRNFTPVHSQFIIDETTDETGFTQKSGFFRSLNQFRSIQCTDNLGCGGNNRETFVPLIFYLTMQ